MKQKMVIKVCMNGPECRSKAMKVAVSFTGVESAALKGDDKTQIEVTGDGVDAVQLTTKLRKKFGYAELLSVAEVKTEKKKPEEKKPEEVKVQPIVWSYPGGMPCYTVCETYPIYHHNEDSFCTIL